MADVVNGSFASPLADALYAQHVSTDSGILSRLYSGMNGFSVALSVFLVLVAYDQCQSRCSLKDIGDKMLTHPFSLILTSKRLYTWPRMEDAVHRAFP